MVDALVEDSKKLQIYEGGREVVDWVVETLAHECEVGK